MSFQNCILREDKTEKSVNLEMSSEYLFSSISDGDTSNSSTGILWSNIYITMGISPESLGSDLCCEDADESVEPAAHLETKCVTVALDSC